MLVSLLGLLSNDSDSRSLFVTIGWGNGLKSVATRRHHSYQKNECPQIGQGSYSQSDTCTGNNWSECCPGFWKLFALNHQNNHCNFVVNGSTLHQTCNSCQTGGKRKSRRLEKEQQSFKGSCCDAPFRCPCLLVLSVGVIQVTSLTFRTWPKSHKQKTPEAAAMIRYTTPPRWPNRTTISQCSPRVEGACVEE